MARYIDADLEVEKINDTLSGISDKGSIGYFALEQFKHMLEIAPTADVVPKSEVDKWKQINEQLHKEMSERMMEERKIERKLVAREIFEEIERETKNHGIIYAQRKIAELKKKYTEGNDGNISSRS